MRSHLKTPKIGGIHSVCPLKWLILCHLDTGQTRHLRGGNSSCENASLRLDAGKALEHLLNE